MGVTVSDGLRRMVVAASRKCGLSFSGVDVLLGDDGYRLCEVNSSPGFEGLERATGVDCAAAMIEYAVQEVERRKKEQAASGVRSADTAGEGKWRVREREYPLQDDHMRIILEAKERDREAQAKADEENATAKADEAKAASSTTTVAS